MSARVTAARLSVVIPVLSGDEPELTSLLPQLAALPTGSEVIVSRACNAPAQRPPHPGPPL